MEWLMWSGLALLYIVLIFTVCVITFRKGHVVLGILGIFVPFLWVIGAVLPPTEGSTYESGRSRYSH
jgi:hypothetical protein